MGRGNLKEGPSPPRPVHFAWVIPTGWRWWNRATAVLFGGSLAIFPGNGDGTFGSPAVVPVGPRLTGVATGDLDGDGHADIAVAIVDDANGEVGYLGVVLGDGQGGFEAAIETFLGRLPLTLALPDLDGDGILDAVAILGSNAVGVCRGVGGANFDPPVEYLAGEIPLALDTADFDGDGAEDVATANSHDTDVSVLLGNGSARLRSVVEIAAPHDILHAIPGDFDGDGLVDAVLSVDLGTNQLIQGNGDATFRLPRPLGFEGGLGVAGRYDADDSLDLVVGGNVLLNDGHGTFHISQSLTEGLPSIAADLRGSGATDLLGGSFFQLEAWLGNGDGTFGPAILTDLPNSMTALSAGKIDGDARDDVAVGTSTGLFNPNTVRVLLSNGDGTFTPTYSRQIGAGPLDFALADATADGNVDLLAANGPSGTLLFVGHGDGTFDDPVTFDAQFASAVFVVDFDQDGILDIFASGSSPPEGQLFRGTGGGGFASPILLEMVSGSGHAVSPLSGSAPDVVIAGSGVLSILVNSRLSPTVASRTFTVVSAADLRVAASGNGPLTYQWRKDGVPLADGGPISGSQTATLTIDPTAFTDAGSYDVVVTDSCTNVTSNAATLAVEFDDVPLSNPFHDDILTIATLGITGGCNTGTSYCPANPVSRAEMAVFLLKAKYGADHVPPPPPPVPTFADVPANAFAAAWIEELANLGVTAGCGNGNYCPDASVTRAEMAVFLLKTLLGLRLRAARPRRHLLRRGAGQLRHRLDRGLVQPRRHRRLRHQPAALLPRHRRPTRTDGHLPRADVSGALTGVGVARWLLSAGSAPSRVFFSRSQTLREFACRPGRRRGCVSSPPITRSTPTGARGRRRTSGSSSNGCAPCSDC